MEPSLATKTEEKKKSQATPESQPDVQTSLQKDLGAPAGMPLFLQRLAVSSAGSGLIQRQVEEEEEEELLQPKLTVSEPNDVYEQEADRVAETVMRMSEPGVQPQSRQPQLHLQDMMGNKAVNRLIQCALPVSQPGDPLEREANQVASDVVRRNQWFQHQAVQTQQSQESQKEKRRLKRSYPDRVQRRSVPLSATRNRMTVSPRVETAIQRARGGGEKLPERVRQPMESAFGAEFANVSIHAGAEANRLNQSLNARAFTSGKNIFFRHGEYKPDIREGQELIAHELVHVCQQADYSGGPIIQRREFGDAVRFDSLPGDPPRALVLGSYPDEDIAMELYGNLSMPIIHAGETSDMEDVIAIDYEQLLSEWRPYFVVLAESLFAPVFEPSVMTLYGGELSYTYIGTRRVRIRVTGAALSQRLPFAYQYLPPMPDRQWAIIRLVAAPGVAVRLENFLEARVTSLENPRVEIYRVQDPELVPVQGQPIDPFRYVGISLAEPEPGRVIEPAEVMVVRRPDGVDLVDVQQSLRALRITARGETARFAYEVIPGEALEIAEWQPTIIRVVKTPSVTVSWLGPPRRTTLLPQVEVYDVPRISDVPRQGQRLSSVGHRVVDIPVEQTESQPITSEVFMESFTENMVMGMLIIGMFVGLEVITMGQVTWLILALAGGMFTYGVVEAFLQRRENIELGGYEVPISETFMHAVGDVPGVSPTIEGITGERLGTGEVLSSIERSSQGGAGIARLMLLPIGVLAYRQGVQIGRQRYARLQHARAQRGARPARAGSILIRDESGQLRLATPEECEYYLPEIQQYIREGLEALDIPPENIDIVIDLSSSLDAEGGVIVGYSGRPRIHINLLEASRMSALEQRILAYHEARHVFQWYELLREHGGEVARALDAFELESFAAEPGEIPTEATHPASYAAHRECALEEIEAELWARHTIMEQESLSPDVPEIMESRDYAYRYLLRWLERLEWGD